MTSPNQGTNAKNYALYRVKVKQKFRQFNKIEVCVNKKTNKIYGIIALAEVKNPKLEYLIVKKIIEKKYQQKLTRDSEKSSLTDELIKINNRFVMLRKKPFKGKASLAVMYYAPLLDSASKEFKAAQKKTKELKQQEYINQEVLKTDSSAL